MKVWLDTDIGSDIDDAVCLAYLLARPDCDLVGISTVSGDTTRRAMLADAQCRVAGRATPIFPGVSLPLLVAERQPHVPQAAVLDRWPHATDFPRGEAVAAMRRAIREAPGEITLLAIGPLTNVALLLASDPEIPALLGGLMIMGGAYKTRFAGTGPRGISEWNIICDPHAAAMVYRAPVPFHRSVGLDVTTQVRLGEDEVRARFTAPLLRPVRDFAEVWFAERVPLTFHDPLAAAALFDHTICGFARGTAEVETTSDRASGLTYWTPGDNGPHEIATTVDPARFFTHFFETLNGQLQDERR